MLDHIEFAVADIFRARDFYDQALVPLGVTLVMSLGSRPDGEDVALGYGSAGKPFFFIRDPAGHNIEAVCHAPV